MWIYEGSEKMDFYTWTKIEFVKRVYFCGVKRNYKPKIGVMSKTYRSAPEDYKIKEKTTAIKPKHTRYCYDCRRNKLLFSTKEKAERYISFNSATIKEESGYAPVRAYYCVACGGWHVTHLSEFQSQSKYEEFCDSLVKRKKNKVSKPVAVQPVASDSLESLRESCQKAMKKISKYYAKGLYIQCEKEILRITEMLQNSTILSDNFKESYYGMLEIIGSQILLNTVA